MTMRHRLTDSTPNLSSLLLGSTDPIRLRDWYCRAFGVEADQFGFITLGQLGILTEQRGDVSPKSPEPGRIIFNLDVADAEAVIAGVEAAGTTWIAPLEERQEGWFATFTHPDGNYVQVIQMKSEMQQTMLAEARKAHSAPTRPFSGFAVADTDAAATFYRDILGLDVTEEHGLLQIWLDERTAVLAYPKPDHAPATYTILNVPVDDIGGAVDSLVESGVEMIRYPGFEQDGRGIARGEGPHIAWFTDPSGNILSVLQDA